MVQMKVVDASDRVLVRENKNLRERERGRVKKERDRQSKKTKK